MKKSLIIGLIVLSLVLVGCSDDVQVSGDVVGIEVEETDAACTDSDGGIDKMTKGIVNAGDELFSDICVAGLLIEYYCDGDKVTSQNMRCSNACSNGKCA